MRYLNTCWQHRPAGFSILPHASSHAAGWRPRRVGLISLGFFCQSWSAGEDPGRWALQSPRRNGRGGRQWGRLEGAIEWRLALGVIPAFAAVVRTRLMAAAISFLLRRAGCRALFERGKGEGGGKAFKVKKRISIWEYAPQRFQNRNLKK